MLNICYNKGAELDIIFNAEKSCLCKIGKVTNIQIDELFIGHQAVNWVDRLKYLGLHFCCQKQLVLIYLLLYVKYMLLLMQF